MADSRDYISKSNDYILEYSKIFINLTSLFLVLSVTFVDKISGSDWYYLIALVVAWSAWVASIYMGSKAVRALVNLQLDIADDDDSDTPSDEANTIFGAVKLLLRKQIFFFFIGISSILILSVLKILVDIF